MTKKSKGFTLSEVLVTLGIVGVIAAITIPRLVNNTSDKTMGIRLARAFEITQNSLFDTINLARQNGDTDVLTLDAIQVRDINPDADANELDNYLIRNNANFFEDMAYRFGLQRNRNYNAAGVGECLNRADNVAGACTAYNVQKVPSVTVIYQNPPVNLPNNIPEARIITRIYIDGNGSDTPNEIGRDIFLFGMANSGRLIPAGAETYNNNIYNEEIDDDCAADARACTARLIKNNWEFRN